ncbi:MAG: Ig-like domain repeat protein [Thaumarchaeota archaeon]|nr:Ig-like domain repeat protein [Nitrososphaerota archaeon]
MSLFVIMMISSIFTNGIFVSQAMADGNSTSTQNSTASASLDATSTAITSTQNTVSVGSQITLTATVTDNSNIPTSPAGSIMWNDNNAGGTFSSAFCNIVSGTCTVTYVASSSAHNAATITATYGGDASHQTSSGTYSITVNSVIDSTSVSITSSSSSFVPGNAITLTATVTDTSSSPTIPSGTLSWSDGNAGGVFGSTTCTLSGGMCTTSYTPSSSATNSITMTGTYAGDTTHQTSSGTDQLSQNTQDSTSAVITSSSQSFVIGNAMTVTATITDTSNSQNVPSGTLSWSDGNAGGVFGSTTCTLSSGMCIVSYTPSSGATNSITITGTYAGDSSHQTSSGTLRISQSTQDPTSVVVTAPQSTISAGGQVTVTATVADTSNSQNVPSGTITWNDGNAGGVFGSTTCTLSSGTCNITYTASSTVQNPITITATYGGDSMDQTSSGTFQLSPSTQDVTSVFVTSSPSTISAGSQVTVTATVNDTTNSQNVPTGTITWNDGSGGGTFDQTSCTLSSNSCTVSYTSSSNPPNAVTITASYQGDARHQTSTGSSSLSANVLHPITIAVTPNPTTFSPGVDVTFTVTVTDTIESSSGIVGLVKWTDNGAGGSFSPDACIITNNRCALEYTPPTNPTNNITITASYGGDPDHSGGSATALLTVNAASSSTSESAPAIQSPSTPQSIPTTQSPSTTQSTPTTQSSTNTPSTTQSNTQSTSQSTTQHNTSPTTQSPSTTQSTPTTQSSTNTPSTTQSNTQSTSQSTSGNPIQQSTSSGKSQQSQQNPEVTISKAISNVVSELETFFKKL